MKRKYRLMAFYIVSSPIIFFFLLSNVLSMLFKKVADAFEVPFD